MATPSDEQVRYDILIDAKSAIQNMKELMRTTSDNAEKIRAFSALVVDSAKAWGTSWQYALNVYKQLNAELSKQKQATLFGKTGGQDLFASTEKYIDSVVQAKTTTEQTGQAAEKMGNSVENASRRSVRGIDAMRIALGAVVAMIVFNVIQAFQNMVKGAIDGLREIESATFNLLNAEKKLSEQGIQISPKDLDDTIKKLQELDPLLSKIQATELVSSVASKVAPNVGLGKKEIDSLTQSIAILAIRNKSLGKSFEEVESQIENAFLSGKVSVGINQLGVKISDQIVQEKAVAMGLVETAAAYDQLDAKQKAHINALTMIKILEENTNEERSHLPDYFKTADAAFGVFQARVSDVLTFLGTKFGPVLQQIFMGLADLLEKILVYWQENETEINKFFALLGVGVNIGLTLVDVFFKLSMIVADLGKNIYKVLAAIPGVGQIMNAVSDRYFKKPERVDTPTGTSSEFGGTNPEVAQAEERNKKIQKAEEDLQKILQDSADKKADIERDYQRKLEDIATNYSQKLEDIARNTAEKKEDAARNYAQKVEDINRDASEKVAQAQQDYRQKEIDREKEYQQRLKELRDKFLFDLEDALRERDARQVLRLIRQYNMDKANLEAKHKLDEQQSKKDLQQKIADIERDRQLKIEAAKREYDDKLKEIAIGEARARDEARIWQQRQLQDARIWHQRQLQEQREYLQRKLRDLAEALAQELKLTQQGAQAIASTLSSVFGSALNGLIPVNGSGAVTGGSLGNGSNWGQLANTWNSLLSTWQNSGMYGTQGLADGGSMLATRPTTLNVGEKTPELVTAIPLNKMGQASSFLPNGMTQSQGGGSLSLRILLSDGLIADIVDTSLDNVATQIEKIVRSK